MYKGESLLAEMDKHVDHSSAISLSLCFSLPNDRDTIRRLVCVCRVSPEMIDQSCE